jgi:hypothetical protein
VSGRRPVNSVASRVLPAPGSAVTTSTVDRRSRIASPNACSSASSSSSRLTKLPETTGVARPAGRAERASMASKATTGLGLPLAR